MYGTVNYNGVQLRWELLEHNEGDHGWILHVHLGDLGMTQSFPVKISSYAEAQRVAAKMAPRVVRMARDWPS